MTLRKSHTAMMDRSPTVFPIAKMSTFAEAGSAQKRTILDEADRISKEERAKLAKHTQSRAGGSTDKPEVDSRHPTRTTNRSAPTRRRSVGASALSARWPRTRPSSCRRQRRLAPATLRERLHARGRDSGSRSRRERDTVSEGAAVPRTQTKVG